MEAHKRPRNYSWTQLQIARQKVNKIPRFIRLCWFVSIRFIFKHRRSNCQNCPVSNEKKFTWVGKKNGHRPFWSLKFCRTFNRCAFLREGRKTRHRKFYILLQSTNILRDKHRPSYPELFQFQAHCLLPLSCLPKTPKTELEILWQIRTKQQRSIWHPRRSWAGEKSFGQQSKTQDQESQTQDRCHNFYQTQPGTNLRADDLGWLVDTTDGIRVAILSALACNDQVAEMDDLTGQTHSGGGRGCRVREGNRKPGWSDLTTKHKQQSFLGIGEALERFYAFCFRCL